MSLHNTLAISTDVVLFSIRNDRLEVLLVALDDGGWRLPGGGICRPRSLRRAFSQTSACS
jgi:hypothetical protein